MFRLFTEVGVFVDNLGQKTRVEELMWPSPPTSVGKKLLYTRLACSSSSFIQLMNEYKLLQSISVVWR
jgi:hypothetical protein